MAVYYCSFVVFIIAAAVYLAAMFIINRCEKHKKV